MQSCILEIHWEEQQVTYKYLIWHFMYYWWQDFVHEELK